MFGCFKKLFEKLGVNGNSDKGVLVGDAVYRLRPVKNFVFGRVDNGISYKWRKMRGKVYLDPASESNPHILIFGMSGFGKSTMLKSLIKELNERGKRIIVFDAHSEHVQLVKALGGNVYDSRNAGINVMALDGLTVGQRISELTSVLKEMYGLGYIQVNKLSTCMWYCYRNMGARNLNSTISVSPKVSDLINEINVFIKNATGVSERNTLTHLMYRLSGLNTGAFSNESVNLDKLGNPALFLTASLQNGDARFLYVHELLQRIYHKMYSSEREKGIGNYLFVDEAQFLIDRSGNESTVLRKLIEEGRKYGFGVVMATHMSTKVPKQVIANAATFLSFYQREPSEVSYISSIMGNGSQARAEAVRNMLSKLRTNQVVLMSTRFREPLVVRNVPLKIGEDIKVQKDDSLVVVSDKRTNPGPEHTAALDAISRSLASHGIRHRILDGPNEPDIVAYTDSGNVAIEYETGKKNPLHTRKMLERRLIKYKKVLVFVEASSYERYSKYMQGLDVLLISSENTGEAYRYLETLGFINIVC